MERGMTRSELAQQSGISKARLSQIMRADANPTLRTLAKLFYAMDDQLWLSRKDKMVADSENRCAWAEGNRSAPPAPSPKISKGIYQSIDCGTIRFSQASNDDTPQCVDSNGLETAA
jgi:transcriptional regulator with XRE-family HTH domain